MSTILPLKYEINIFRESSKIAKHAIFCFAFANKYYDCSLIMLPHHVF